MRKILSLLILLVLIPTPVFAFKERVERLKTNGVAGTVPMSDGAGGLVMTAVETTDGDPITWQTSPDASYRWNFNLTGDDPYIEFIYSASDASSYTEFRPGALDLRVMDDVAIWDTTPNYRFYDTTSSAEDAEIQLEDGEIVFKAVGDVSGTGTYTTREFLVYHMIANAGGGSNADETLQIGGSDVTNVVIGETANPDSPFQVTENSATTNALVDFTTFNLRSSGTVAASFGQTIRFTMEDASGSAGELAAALDIQWQDATNGSEDSEIIFRHKIAGAMAEAFRVDENTRIGIGTANPDNKLNVDITDAETSSVTNIAALDHHTSGTAAVGFGIGLLFRLEDAGGSTEINAAGLEVTWQDATNGAAYSELVFKTRVNNSFAERARFDESGKFSVGNTNPTGYLSVDFANASSITAEKTMFYADSTTQTLTDGTTIANWRNNRFMAPTINGVAAGGTETVTSAATVYINAAPSGSNITFTNGPYAFWVDAGGVRMDGRVAHAKGSDVASADDITLGTDGNYFDITGTTTISDIATAGWEAGSTVTLQFDGSLTVTHNAAPDAGYAAILLAGAANFSATANDTLTLTYDGTTWREVGRAVI